MDINATALTPVKFVSGERRLKRHNKSRAGCYRCKVKRIKCSESKPKCNACLKNAAQCLYPEDQKNSPPLQINLVSNNHLGFSLHDMRLFHDFMTVSHPHLPLESEKAWLEDVPIIAQQHEFLMHGILALGAAHLHARTSLELKESVDRHRALAMQGLNSMELTKMSNGRDYETRLSALLATCYLLTFASSYMGDSLSLFLVLVRGCNSLTKQIVAEGHASPLLPWKARSATTEPHLEVMRRRLQNVPLRAEDEVTGAKISLDLVEASCVFLPFQQRLFEHMRNVVDTTDEPFESYTHFINLWNELGSLDPADFGTFCEDSNSTSVVLQAHFLAIEALVRPWLKNEVNDQLGRDGLGALPASATVAAKGQGLGELINWPISMLEEQRRRFRSGR